MNTWEGLQAINLGRALLNDFYEHLKKNNPESYEKLMEELQRGQYEPK